MTKREKLMLLEVKNALDNIIKAYKTEINQKEKLLHELEENRDQILKTIRNQDLIDKRIEDLVTKMNGEPYDRL